MKVKIRAEYIKSIDPDYNGQQQYHMGERVKIFNPDNPDFEYNNKRGTWQGVAKIYIASFKFCYEKRSFNNSHWRY